MAKISNENYVCIHAWMINELKLKDNELLVYAIIFMFSQDEESSFRGSLNYLANWCSCTKQGIMKNLKSLLEKGLIVKKENVIQGVKFVEYYATKFNGVCNLVYQGGMQLSLPNNKVLVNNKVDNKEIVKKENNIKERFTIPTLEQVIEYCINERQNDVDPETFYNFYESKGWMVGKNKMKNWKAAVRTWENKNKKEKGNNIKTKPSWYNEYENELKEKGVEQETNNNQSNIEELKEFFVK